MARILPDGWEALECRRRRAARDRDVATCSRTLPDDCHGRARRALDPHRTRLLGLRRRSTSSSSPSNGRVLLIEQKSGFLEETGDGLVKAHGAFRKSDCDRTSCARSRRSRHAIAQSRQGRTAAADDAPVHRLPPVLPGPSRARRRHAPASPPNGSSTPSRAGPRSSPSVVDLLVPTPAAGSADAATALRFFSDELLLVADVGHADRPHGSAGSRVSSSGLAQVRDATRVRARSGCACAVPRDRARPSSR